MGYDIFKNAHISKAKFRRLVEMFSADLTARQTASLCRLNIHTVNRYYMLLREAIAEECAKMARQSGIIEVDESYFGAKRVRGRRGRGAHGKTIVFGLFKRQGSVYTEIVPDCSKATLQGIILGKADIASVINSDGWRGYDGLVDVGYDKHFRVEHGKNEFANGAHHINGIECFWSHAKTRLAKFRGVAKHTFILHLKECEWRFNHRGCNLYKIMLKLIKSKR